MRFARFHVAFALAALHLNSWAAFAPEGCPSTTPKNGSGSGSGQSTSSTDDDSDLFFATSAADADLLTDLADNSGVVCDTCWNGEQCKRSVTLGSGTKTTTNTAIPGSTPSTSGWKVDMSWSGDYTVKCGNCKTRPI